MNPTNGEYAGRVIAIREKNGYSDSDFMALVANETGGFGWVETGTTRFAGGFIAVPDADAATIARYAEFYEAGREAATAAQTEYDLRKVGIGSPVQVVGGRKYKGKTGTVTWFGEDQYRTTKFGTFYRVGVTTVDGDRFFVPATYVEVNVNGEWVEPVNAIETVNGFGGACPEAVVWAMGMYPLPKNVQAAYERRTARATA